MTVTMSKDVAEAAIHALLFQHAVYEKYLYEGTVSDLTTLLEFAAQLQTLQDVIEAMKGAVK
jgi:hypothetical protein